MLGWSNDPTFIEYFMFDFMFGDGQCWGGQTIQHFIQHFMFDFMFGDVQWWGAQTIQHSLTISTNI